MTNIGYILFGHKKGFTIYKKQGCAIGFSNEIQNINNKDISELLSINLNEIDIESNDFILGITHEFLNDDFYTIISKYKKSKDYYGRNAVHGVGLVFKNHRLDSGYVLKLLDRLFIELESIENDDTHRVKGIDAVLTSVEMKKINIDFDEILEGKYYCILTNDIQGFIRFGFEKKYYKTYAASDSFIREEAYEKYQLLDKLYDIPENKITKINNRKKNESHFPVRENEGDSEAHKEKKINITSNSKQNEPQTKQKNLKYYVKSWWFILLLIVLTIFILLIFNLKKEEARNSNSIPAINRYYDSVKSVSIDTPIYDPSKELLNKNKDVPPPPNPNVGKDTSLSKMKKKIEDEIINYTNNKEFSETKTKDLLNKSNKNKCSSEIVKLLIEHQKDNGTFKNQSKIGTFDINDFQTNYYKNLVKSKR